MKIPFSIPKQKPKDTSCPHCGSEDVWKHGSYTRKWFHRFGRKAHPTRKVLRYRCRNADCPHKTFTIQCTDTLPFCRFLLPDLVAMDNHYSSSPSIHSLSRIVSLSRSVVRRVLLLLSRTRTFLHAICREITAEEGVGGEFIELVQEMKNKYCCKSLQAMWFRHIYGGYHPEIVNPQKKVPVVNK